MQQILMITRAKETYQGKLDDLHGDKKGDGDCIGEQDPANQYQCKKP